MTTHDLFFYQNTQKSNFHSALQLLAAYFCINAMNLSPNLPVALQVYFSGHSKKMSATLEQKTSEVSLAERTTPTT